MSECHFKTFSYLVKHKIAFDMAALVCDIKRLTQPLPGAAITDKGNSSWVIQRAPAGAETENSEAQQEAEENPDLEDGEIEDDDDEDIPPEEPPSIQIKETAPLQILPAAVPTDTNIFAQSELLGKDKRRRSTERKSDKHLTEAEKCVRMLHKMERAERERRDRMRREQQDDWAGNVEKAIASVLKKDKHSGSGGEEEEEEEVKRGRKRKKRERGRKKKHRKVESPPKTEEVEDDEMLNVRGGSPEGKTNNKEDSPFQEGEQGYESYDSEYDSESYHNRNNKRQNFEGERKRRNRRETRRERKNFRKENRKKEPEQNRLQMQDANSICMFYMQGKCHKGDECPYSHDALPPMKMELCKFYLMDCCAKRDKCLYMHSEFPCKYYHTGLKCFAKDNCKFAHGKPLSDSLKSILLKHLETAPKEILGDFPRLSREGAQHMVNQTQKTLEVQYGVKPNAANNSQNDKTGIPSLFDINIPFPPELMLQQNTPNDGDADSTKAKSSSSTTSSPEKGSGGGDKPTKVRHTRWNDEPAVPLAMLGQAFAASASAATMPGMSSVFSSLTLQDQQKIHEYQLSYQMKGFYSEQDQDMRINSNGDVDMRALPQLMSKDASHPPMANIPPVVTLPASVPSISFEQYKQDAGLTTNYSPGKGSDVDITESKMDTDIRNLNSSETNLTIVEPKKEDASDTSVNLENSLTIDEKAGDSGSELPSNLPKKQRELFLRIQAQQKENIPENQTSDGDTPTLKDDDWYSSDDDNDNNENKMVIHLEDEPIEEKEEEPKQEPEVVMSSPPIKPVEVIDKLGDLSKIDISAEVTKLLTSIKSNQSTLPSTAATTSSTEVKKSRDPRQAKNIDSVVDITSPGQSTHSDPRTKSSSRRDSRDTNPRAGLSIYEQGIISPEHQDSRLSDQDAGSKDVDLRTLDSLPKDLDMRPSFGDTDLRQGASFPGSGRQDVDLRQLGLPFKAMQNYTPASEIDASISSHSPITYRVHVCDIPRPDYSGLKLNSQDAQVTADPRLRKIFRIPSTDEKDSPMSPKQQHSPPKITRQDPRKRKREEAAKSEGNPMNYSQQLQLLQNSAFYQSLTSNQKLMLNQEIATQTDQTVTNDPILNGILSNLGLIPSLANTNGCAINILASVNSLVPSVNPMGPGMMGGNMPGNMGPGMPGMGHGMGPNMGPNMPQNMPPNMNPNMGGMGPNMMGPMNPNMPNPNMGGGIMPNIGPGLLGAAPPGMPMGAGNMNQNNFQINLDPRNGGLLGQAPFENFPENQNFQYNDEFYPNNDDGGNFQGGNNFNNSRNERNFRNDRNSQGNNRRGRSWNNRHNNRNYNRNNNRNRSNRSYTPP